ncbi:restriction endonuclease subunit S [Lacticaseibacillus saniviri]
MMSLGDTNWGAYSLDEIFNEIVSVKGTSIDRYIIGKTPYITTTSFHNGLSAYVEATPAEITPGNVLTVDPIKGKTFYQQHEFVGRGGAGSAITVLKSPNLNKNIGLFLSTLIEKDLSRISSYGTQMNKARVAKHKLLLPVTVNNQPNWQFMNDYISEKMRGYKIPPLKDSGTTKQHFRQASWGAVNISSIFEIKRGKSGAKNSLSSGKTPLISARKIQNGFDSFVQVSSSAIEDGNVLSLNNNGDGGAGLSYYQPFKFTATQDVTVLKPKETISKFSLLFLRQVINMQQDKFGFGNKANAAHLRKQKIMLPLKTSGKPDWQFMEDYIKSLPNADLI